ncbi:unnamed protein product [Camellia sinensis]
MFRESDNSYWLGKEGGYRAQVKVAPEIYHCQHEWNQRDPLPSDRRPECTTCKRSMVAQSKAFCAKCNALTCALCANHYFNYSKFVMQKPPIPYNQKPLLQEQQEYIRWCEAEMKRLREEAIQYKTELEDLRMSIQLEKDERELRTKGKFKEDELRDLEAEATEAEELNAFVEMIAQGEVKEKKKNMLYNLTVELEIPNLQKISLNAILDTGATTCVVDSESVPADALEDNTYTVEFNGINSQSKANKKLKGGKMYIGDNWFRIPYTYSFPFHLGGRIQMIIGCNFIRAMYGGVRIEGNNVTFYKNVITIQTRQSVNLLEVEKEEDFTADHYYDPSPEWILHSAVISPTFEEKFPKLMKQLQNCEVIGEDPMKLWSSNQITCKLDLKNSDFIIDDKPMKHITPAMKESFKKHIDQLLDLKVIRPSKSRHRTTAFIVNSGTYIDLVTKEEKRGKEHMVCNYKRLNDNTHKDQYKSVPADALEDNTYTVEFNEPCMVEFGLESLCKIPNFEEISGKLRFYILLPSICRQTKSVGQHQLDIIKFLNDYLHLATRSGRLFVGEELSKKLWSKMPGDLGERIKKAFVGHSRIYSKFDLKSEFHQVAMHPDFIEWTAFWTPLGLYEWLVMPFAQKATAVPADLITKLENLSLGPKEKPKESRGLLRVHRNPNKLLQDELDKLKLKHI